MSLLRFDEIGKKQENEIPSVGCADFVNDQLNLAKVSFGQLESKKKLKEICESLDQDRIHIFNTRGQFSSYELLDALLNYKLAPSAFYLTAWTVSEMALRTVTKLKSEGKITALHGLFDYRVKERRHSAFQLILGQADSLNYTTASHAKIMVLDNDKMPVTVIGSANFSKNPRMEAGVIFCSRKIADNCIKWIVDEISSNGKH